MSIYTTPSRNHTAVFAFRYKKRTNQLVQSSDLTKASSKFGQQLKSQLQDNQLAAADQVKKGRESNKTYVLSSCNPKIGRPVTPRSEQNLTLQKRKTVSKGSSGTEKETHENIDWEKEQLERRLTLQRLTRTGSIERGSSTNLPQSPIVDNAAHQAAKNTKHISQRNTCSKSLAGSSSSLEASEAPTSTESRSRLENPCGKGAALKSDHFYLVPTSSKSTVGAKLNGKDYSGQKPEKGVLRSPGAKSGSLERQRTPSIPTAVEGFKTLLKSGNHQDAQSPASAASKTFLGIKPKSKMSLTTSLSAGGDRKLKENADGQQSVLVKRETEVQMTCPGKAVLTVENSAVMVAVRARPFSSREKSENAFQVVFMDGQDTIVQHPETKQTFNFMYDFSFWSSNQTHPDFASQEMVYDKVALPLLERAFEGFNTCLFTYGQTGSGKSYTMMGFSEEEGIIPRFCEQLFSRVAKTKTQQVIYNLEMSYFEVYNEKIHDLLVAKDQSGQKKQPLRVREHPVFGPYVQDLSVNVVTSYSDIQSWLELGNKQRATAATGMNDKSSRSHSVFTIVMTQTKTEFVEEEEHDHRVTSRINLVDLAGSERCCSTQASGDRLKEGMSINKSLLTLGKVISALSEHSQTRKKAFIPYRESVLTWLLKESLGGNSKTAMIATISPASSYVEETLSTLRYAQQARMIINVAKVNEDTNAKLIRELKGEIEKLKAAQMSARGIESEKYRLCQQEIAAMKMKLGQQEREMQEAQRTWKLKLEQAEKRKVEETKVLQKAGITFKVDNRLPNLVNLNEDPQLSEMLLYMIKEGQIKVGKYKPTSTHDIQLSGALIADDHCTIRNLNGIVSITPVGDAKTYVNGNLISESTTLHHGDRVILGGDHYFRFNHPIEVQEGKRPSCGAGLSSEGPKDFEFAKNELLTAQKAKLEAEIEEARLKAKEEMIQGIQVAKEMAQRELSCQKTIYENKIKELEVELEEESRKKKFQEINNQKAVTKIEELEKVKQRLEQEVHLNKKRLQLETLATKQALEDHNIRHARILEALEAEKWKLADDLARMQNERNRKAMSTKNVNSTEMYWSSMKLSVMIQEANTISNKLKKHTVFSRYEPSDKENLAPGTQIRVQNTKLGITTFWTLETFESKLAAMRELIEGNTSSRDDDVFYDPGDEWEPDLSTSSVSLFSRRRSRSLMKNRRISSCLYEIQEHSIQSLQSSHSSGLMNKSKRVCSSVSETVLPDICKELMGLALESLERNSGTQESIADRVLTDLMTIHTGMMVISKAYKELDEESQENLFASNQAAQYHCIKVTSSLERLVVLIKHWLDGSFSEHPNEELQNEVRKLGGYLQLLLQGCCSDISSMVKEAQNKASQAVKRAARHLGQLAAFTGMELHLSEEKREEKMSEKWGVILALYNGIGIGLEDLLCTGLKRAKDMQYGLQRGLFPQHEEMNIAVNFAVSIQNYLMENKKKDIGATLRQEDKLCEYQDLKTANAVAVELVKFNESVGQVCQTVVSALKGEYEDVYQLRKHTQLICSLAKSIHDCFSSLLNTSSGDITVNSTASAEKANSITTNSLIMELNSTSKMLNTAFSQLREEQKNVYDHIEQKTEGRGKPTNTVGVAFSHRSRMVPKHVYKLTPETTAGVIELSSTGIKWV
nr:PREDICTED: kinesin-like protein KIF14 isoform X2 [Latimeria chalumnae]|eukprot:XP_005997779.2 PREDICTED: kinesin-like protein KIF14 isoform X2 [Latimeria chalumnae]